MNNYCIYMHKNKVNGKKYIGQTCQKPEYRWGKEGKGYEQCPLFYSAIQKYGWDNFEHTIILTGLSAEEANLKEQELISFYKTTQKEFGYNLQKGGNNRIINESTRKKLSFSTTNRWKDPEFKKYFSDLMKQKWQDPTYREKIIKSKTGQSHISEEGKKRISEARKKYIEEHGTPTQGKGHSEATKQKIRENMLGEKNPMYGKTTSDKQKQIAKETMSSPVMCVETQQIFSSRKEAAEWCGLKSASGISEYLAGRKKSAGKHPITKEKLHWQNVEKPLIDKK